ncbi:cytochrome P450 [Pseudoroseicyclus tamaricis]|uniref:Cytochrome P450 n=1 Tax=Pseudoroseicyclus tamaricis TaxID=2705421 RepID=A0A6B2K1X6_9RHOB|nr:cytochrome P450 [Pseudoroseicyclus tamaricis]NDV00406.1 cytochrome P450 [Pseudoroseicyclus tamaricis]
MLRLSQSPTDPAFVQDPYPFYERARAGGDLFEWEEYGLVCATSHRAVGALLRDRRLGREAPPECAPEIAEHLRPFYDIEAHSMLELEPPRHKRLRGLVLRAFTSRRIAALGPGLEALCADLVAAFPDGPFDLIEAYAKPIPAITICRLLGTPEEDWRQLVDWSNAMVAMYQARRTPQIEAAAMGASTAFAAYIREVVAARRSRPGDDLITELIAAEEAGESLSTDELVTTCILLLNAGHEATVHTIGNAATLLLPRPPGRVDEALVEEVLRFDPPLHMFTRWVYEPCELFGHSFQRGDQVACLLAAAGRDPSVYDDAATFDPSRYAGKAPAHAAFGGGIHFCVGAPLARLELLIGLRALFAGPALSLAEPPQFADLYHFHGHDRLMVTR